MLNEQKKLLADVRAAEKTARKLCDMGVKISGVFQKLRSAGDELDTRIRYIEKEERPVAPKTQQQPTKADYLSLYANHSLEELGEVKADIEKTLAKKPDNARALVALEAVNELLAAKK